MEMKAGSSLVAKVLCHPDLRTHITLGEGHALLISALGKKTGGSLRLLAANLTYSVTLSTVKVSFERGV